VVRGCDFDLRGLNLKRGDLVLLVDGEFEFEHSKLLVVFDRFVNTEEEYRRTKVQLFGVAQPCDFGAIKTASLKTPYNFNGILLPNITLFPDYRALNIIYTPSGGYVGEESIITALSTIKGFELYATMLKSQLASSPVTIPGS